MFTYFFPWIVIGLVWKKFRKKHQIFCVRSEQVEPLWIDVIYLFVKSLFFLKSFVGEVQYLKSTWHSPYTVVYIDPLLAYLLVSVPSILGLKVYNKVRTRWDAEGFRKMFFVLQMTGRWGSHGIGTFTQTWMVNGCLGGGFKYLLVFTPTWGNDPIWLICFKRLNQLAMNFHLSTYTSPN